MRLLMIVFMAAGLVLARGDAESAIRKPILRVADQSRITFSRMMEEVAPARVVFVGETHTSMADHRLQLKVIKDLRRRGIPVAIGLEMISAERQKELDDWVAGKMSLKKMVRLYYQEWRVPWPYYRNLFRYARKHGIPVIGLNVPERIPAKVAKSGFNSLTTEERAKLPPEITCEVGEEYRLFVARAHRMHTTGNSSFVHFCEAQMVWNKAMAWHLAGFLKKNPERTVVVLTGTGHALKQGMPQSLLEFHQELTATIIPEYPELPRMEVTSSDADYLALKRLR